VLAAREVTVIASPGTKAARHAQIASILTERAAPVRSQEELADRLAQVGFRVTQATLSRDLEELGAVRLRGPDGALVYALTGELGPGGLSPGGLSPGGLSPGGLAGARGARRAPDLSGLPVEPAGRLARVAAELLVTAEASGNLVVLRTPAGAAQLLASTIDHAGWSAVLGTVGGDDTVLVIARDPAGGEELARALLRLAERGGSTGGRTAGGPAGSAGTRRLGTAAAPVGAPSTREEAGSDREGSTRVLGRS
jgi:transcriptional regulator of arginine metabolism